MPTISEGALVTCDAAMKTLIKHLDEGGKQGIVIKDLEAELSALSGGVTTYVCDVKHALFYDNGDATPAYKMLYAYDDGTGVGTYGLPDGAGVGISVNGMQNWVTQNNRGEWNQPTCEASPCNLHVGQGAGQPHVHGDMFFFRRIFLTRRRQKF